jgi:hypothetical protein
MATVDVSAVIKLTTKASTLNAKGHFARAAEFYANAIAAAEALSQRDCLVVAFLQVLRANALLGVGEDAPGAAVATSAYLATRRLVFVDLLPAPLATLQRRHAAGTLARGACLPHEQAVFAAKVESQAKDVLASAGPAARDAIVRRFAADVGVEVYLMAARLALEVFATGADITFAMPHAALQAACTCVVDGIGLLEQGREGYNSATEACYVRNLQIMAGERLRASSPWHALIVSAWRRLEGSGVLQRRGGFFSDGIQLFESGLVQQHARAAADVAARGLHACALPSCGAREAHASHFQLCGACKTERYCCKAHHVADWLRHKAACKAARKAAAAREEAGGSARTNT